MMVRPPGTPLRWQGLSVSLEGKRLRAWNRSVATKAVLKRGPGDQFVPCTPSAGIFSLLNPAVRSPAASTVAPMPYRHHRVVLPLYQADCTGRTTAEVGQAGGRLIVSIEAPVVTGSY